MNLKKFFLFHSTLFKNILTFSTETSIKRNKMTRNLKLRSKKQTDSSKIIKKFDTNTITSPPLTPFKQTNNINTIDFDKFTEKISNSETKYENEKEEIKENNFNLIFPWNSNLYKEKPKEKNIISPVDLYHVIKETDAIATFKKFLIGLSEYDFGKLSPILENSFLSKLRKNMSLMKDKSYKISFENLENATIKLDLFNLINVFAVGVSINRKRNKFASNYIINESKFEKAPIRQITVKRLSGTEKGIIIMQFHISITSNILLKIEDEQNNLIYKDNKDNKSLHIMILEAEVLECEYKALKNMIRHSNIKEKDLQNTNISDIKMKEKANNLKIIDFDNFMKGNDLIKPETFYD